MKLIKKLPRFLSVNFIGACEEFLRQTGKREVRLGEFLAWLRNRRREKQMETEKFKIHH